MTIDDFDVNDISDKLGIRKETDDISYSAQQGQHDDGLGVHNDNHDDAGPPCHDDTVTGAFHNDHTCGHDDGHFDLDTHDDHDDCHNSITGCIE